MEQKNIRIFMNLSINTIVKLKVTGFKPFNATEKKPSGTKIQSRYVREEGGLGQFEIKVFELPDAKALKGKSIQLENCNVFRPDQDYAPSYWNSTSKPVEIKENVDKPVVNTIVTGTVEALESFTGEKTRGYSFYFVDNVDDAETIYAVKVIDMDEATAKSLLHKDVTIEQCKPLSKTSYITEVKPKILQSTPQKD